MMKAILKGKYGTDNKNTGAASVAMNAGDVRLRASMTDATFINGPSLNGLTLTVEKPGFFMVDYDVPKKDFRFQFMNSIKVLDKPLKLTYIHGRGDNRTILDGALVFDSANKVSANYMFGSGNCKLKYTYVHEGLRTFDQCYDLSKNSWDFAVSQRVYGDDLVKASYQTSSRVLGLEWTKDSKINGAFKIAASVDLAEEVKKPKITAETTWTFETSLTKKRKVSLKKELSDDGIFRLSASYAINTGDIKLEASTTTASIGSIQETIANIHGITIEKPGIFNIHYEYDAYRKGVFQFMNSFKVMDKPLRLTYQHQHVNNRTILDGALEFDSANMVSANYILGSEKCKFKYTYVHGGSRTFEQCYDTSKYSWDFMVSQRLSVSEDEDLVARATYQTSSRVMGLELVGRCPWPWPWDGTSSSSKAGCPWPWGWGRLSSKLRASIDLKEEVKKAKFSFETTLDWEM